MTRVAVCLSGCGVFDGSEIHESVITLPEPALGPIPDLPVSEEAAATSPLPELAIRRLNGEGGWVQFKNELPADRAVLVWFWAVIHDRPVSWAIQKGNWPLHQRRRRLPSATTMSRRLRSPDVQAALREIEQQVFRTSEGKPLIWRMDGKPLPKTDAGRKASKKTKGRRVVRGKSRRSK